MEYSFYIYRLAHLVWNSGQHKYIEEPADQPKNIEEAFDCKYVKMEGLNEYGKVKNMYTESYAETEELRVHIPEEVLYENTDISLTLLFPATSEERLDITSNERRFFEYVSGRRVEWYDTFRRRFAVLVLINKPELVQEVLYGDTRYREVKYTFKNIYGRTFDTSKSDVVFTVDSSVLDSSDYLS